MKVKKLCLFIILLYFISSFWMQVYGNTVDDVRQLVGKDRVDEIFTNEEIHTIIEQYELIEQSNMYLKLFEIGKEININADLDAQYQELELQLQDARDELATVFQTGQPLISVLQKKSTVESILHNIDSLKDRGYDINVEYTPNVWEERYYQVQDIIKEMGTYFDIGQVGNGLKGPLDNSFKIRKSYGFHLNESEDAVEFHNGIDLYTSSNTFVFSQWNGVVSRVYTDNEGFYNIEISHGTNLKTIYKYLKSVDVSVGDEVFQYEYMGVAGDNSNIDGVSYMHFSIMLDDEYINPLYMYGSMGLQAFKEYVSNHPDEYTVYQEVEQGIVDTSKSDSTKEEDMEIKSETGLILGSEVEGGFNSSLFYENIEKEMEERAKKNGE